MKAYRDVEDQERFFRRMQADKYTHLYSATFEVPFAVNANTPVIRNAILQVEEDADFHITHMVGSVISPLKNGQRSNTLSLGFQMAGCSTGRVDRGVDFQMSDPGNGRTLTKVANSRDITLEGEYIPFAAVFPPGFAFRFRGPVPFDYYVERKRRLLLTVRNRGTIDSEVTADTVARVTFGFLGHRVNA